MRDSDDNTRVSSQGPWARAADVVDGTNRMLATGASWSGHERNHLFFGGLPNHQFVRLSGISGLDDPGDSRAFATLDFDHDGWLDIALVNISAPRLRLLRNEIGERPSARENRFIAIRFVGGNAGAEPSREWSSRDGLGCYLEVDLGDGSKVYREHRLDDGFKAQNSATMIVGIGRHERVHSVKVRWLSGKTQSLSDVPAGTLLTVHEDPSKSPTGQGFVRTPYRDSTPPPERSADSWKSGLLPHEPSSNTLVINRTGQTGAVKPGGLVLYTAMATWCAACAGEVPEFKALRGKFGSDELAMYGVPVDSADTKGKLQSWATKFRPPYELLIDLSPSEREMARSVIDSELRDVSRLPATIVTDSSGRVVLASWGVPSVSDLRKLLWRSATD